jgi:hypothetical protein
MFFTVSNGHHMNNTEDTEQRKDETRAIPGDHLVCLSTLASTTYSEIKVSALKATQIEVYKILSPFHPT